MYQVVICDDDQIYIEDLKGMIIESVKSKDKICFYEYHSGIELLKEMPEDVDILFMDIQMEGLDGNETAKVLREKSFGGVMVLCSGIYNPTPETIEIAPYRYLLKQNARVKNIQVIEEIFHEADRRNQCHVFEAYYRREKILLRTADILFFMRYRNGSRVFLISEQMKRYNEGTLSVRYTLEELEEKLASMDFAMPHNSYLLNMRRINNYDLESKSVQVENERIFISRSKQSKFMKQLMQYMRKKYERDT